MATVNHGVSVDPPPSATPKPSSITNLSPVQDPLPRTCPANDTQTLHPQLCFLPLTKRPQPCNPRGPTGTDLTAP